MLLDIKKLPDGVLRKVCEPVKDVGKQERILLDNMVETMSKNNGLGLAAPQVGETCRLFVAKLDGKIYKIINPEIIEYFGIDVMEEGCLSIPNYIAEVERFYSVVLKGLDENGEEIKINAEGLLARIFQHEIDHLDGKLIVDYEHGIIR